MGKNERNETNVPITDVIEIYNIKNDSILQTK